MCRRDTAKGGSQGKRRTPIAGPSSPQPGVLWAAARRLRRAHLGRRQASVVEFGLNLSGTRFKIYYDGLGLGEEGAAGLRVLKIPEIIARDMVLHDEVAGAIAESVGPSEQRFG